MNKILHIGTIYIWGMHKLHVYDMIFLLKLFNYFSGKAIGIGYKNWDLTSDDGYPYKIIPYQGKKNFFLIIFLRLLVCWKIYVLRVSTLLGLYELTDWITPLCLPLILWRRNPEVLWKFALQMIVVLFVRSIIKA